MDKYIFDESNGLWYEWQGKFFSATYLLLKIIDFYIVLRYTASIEVRYIVLKYGSGG